MSTTDTTYAVGEEHPPTAPTGEEFLPPQPTSDMGGGEEDDPVIIIDREDPGSFGSF